MKGLTEYAQPLQWLQAQQAKMVATLIEWARINSGSYHLEGLTVMRQILIDAFAPLQANLTLIDATQVSEMTLSGQERHFTPGSIISLKKRADAPLKILLCGHMDSVYGRNHAFQEVTWLDDNRLRGPAVADMKGGLLVMLYALLALEQSSVAANIGWEVIINADEEIGSPGSAAYLEAAAPHYDVGLVFEPSMTPQGALAGERKGNGKFTIIAHGKAAHAGRDFAAGRNAICFLAEVITRLDHLNQQVAPVTINVATIAGGDALNRVPDIAVAQLDIRTKSHQDESWFFTAAHQLLAEFNQRDGYHLEITGGFGRKPKPLTQKTLALLERVKHTGVELNLALEWLPSGGCCDGNNLAAQGLAVVDTLGVRGGQLHCSEEFILIDSLVERAQLSALLLMTLASEKH